MKPDNRTTPTLAALLAMQAICLGSLPVSVTNAGFEEPVPPSDGGFIASATGWSNVNFAFEIGVWNPGPDETAQAPEGLNVGYVYGGVEDAGLSQVLTATLQADATYNLSVKVGNSITYAYDGYRVQLLAGGTLLAEDNNTLSPAADSFVTASVNYTYNVGLHAALVGQPLEIRLLGMGQSEGTEGETEFDDVRLTVALANPVATPGGPYSVFLGGSLLLDGSASLPSDGATITTYEWDLDNDGDFDEAITGATPAAITEATLVATYGMSLGANTIKLRVTDSAAKTSITETTVNILPDTSVIYEPFAYAGTALNGQSGSSEVGLTGAWTASGDSFLGPNLAYGSLVTRGAGVGNLQGGINRFGGARAVSTQALAGNGLLANGATLWFSVIMGYDLNGNVSNSRLAFALANSNFNTANNQYNIPDVAPETGSGIGVQFGGSGVGNGRVAASEFRNTGNPAFGTLSPVLYGAGQSGLIVGKITWGAATDTIELYLPGPDLILPENPVSTLTTNVDQSTFDTITWARGDRVVMDEIRFGATYEAVVESGSSWDLNGTAAGAGGPTPNGTWNSGDANWNVAPDGTLATIPWQPGGVATFSAGNDATGTYTVTVDGTREVGGIVFEDGTVTLTGGTALSLTANSTFTVAQGLTATIATPLAENAAGRQLSKAGNGILVLSGDNSALTGGVLVNGGAIRFDSPSSIPGTGRNAFVSLTSTAMFGPAFGAGNIPTALANRIADSSPGTIAADNYASTGFDFNTPGLTLASLGALGNVNYTGMLTPNGTTYRLGGGGGTLTMGNTNALTDTVVDDVTNPNSLVVNGTGTVILPFSNDYTGATTITGGSTLRIMAPTATSGVTVNQPASSLEIGHGDALGAGPLTIGGGFGTAPTVLGIGTVVSASPVTLNGGVNVAGSGSLTLGTVTLNNNVIINNINTTNPTTLEAFTAIGAARTLTFSGNGGTIVTGAIGDGTGITNIVKNGDGTLTLGGVNTYTGTLVVNNAGTLRVVSPGSLPSGAVTLNNTSTLSGNGTIGGNVTVTAAANVAPGNNGVGTLPITGNLTISAMANSSGTLSYQLGPIAASDRITVGGTLAIGTNVFGFNDFVFTNVGGLQNGTYKLITSGAPIGGTLQAANLSGPIGPVENGTTGTLQISDGGSGNDIELVVTGAPAGSPYATWSGNLPFDGDANGDGVSNGLAFLLGAAGPNANALGLLPTVTQSGGGLVLTFSMLDAASRGTAAASVQWSNDLGITDHWTTNTAQVPEASSTVNEVVFVITPNGTLNNVVATIPATKAAGGKLFGRLEATK